MTQLTKGMYGHEFHSLSNLFGLSCGQMRGGYDRTHNTGWYNKAGEKLGFGDLSAEDFQRISNELEDGELFIVLSEGDSFCNFVTRPGIIGSMAEVRPDVEAPGIDYVADKAIFVIAKNEMYSVTYRWFTSKEETVERYGIKFKVIKKGAVRRFMVGPGFLERAWIFLTKITNAS